MKRPRQRLTGADPKLVGFLPYNALRHSTDWQAVIAVVSIKKR